MQLVDLKGAKKTPLQGVHWEGWEAPSVKEAVPGAQGMHPLEVCPGAGL